MSEQPNKSTETNEERAGRISRAKVFKSSSRIEQRTFIYSQWSDERKSQYQEIMNKRRKSGAHRGSWTRHDDDCWCGGAAGRHCNRGGYCWSCCGSCTEDSICIDTPAGKLIDPLDEIVMKVVKEECNDCD